MFERGGFTDRLEEACWKFLNCIYVLKIWHSPLWRAYVHAMFLDSHDESVCKPWEGIVMCLCDHVCNVR